jgi:hypothetical protein
LKAIGNEICIPLSIIFNKCITEGTFPDKMKTAHIIPIYKGKSKKELTNYRPISLLTSLSKLFEKIIHTRIYKFLTNNNLLNDYQFGFRSNTNTVDTITSFLGNLIQKIENGEYNMGICIDLSKALTP